MSVALRALDAGLVANDHFAPASDDHVDLMSARRPSVGGDAAAERSIAPGDAGGFVAAAGDADRDGKRRARIARIVDAEDHLHRRRRAATVGRRGGRRQGGSHEERG